MGLLAESITGLPSSGPAVLDTCKTFAMKLRGRLSATSGADDVFVKKRERSINAQRHSQPIRRDPLLGERHPSHHQRSDDHSDLCVSYTDVLAVHSRNGSGKSFEPHRIFFRRFRHPVFREPRVNPLCRSSYTHTIIFYTALPP